MDCCSKSGWAIIWAIISYSRGMQENVGVGQSLLELVLHSRVKRDAVVPKTVTRIVIAAAACNRAEVQDVCEFHAAFLGATDVDVTGLLLVQPGGASIHALEASPETVNALLRHIVGSPLFGAVSVVSSVEDCPHRCFGTWAYRAVSLSPEGALGEAASGGAAAAAVAHAVSRGLVQCGSAMKQVAAESVREGGGAVVDG